MKRNIFLRFITNNPQLIILILLFIVFTILFPNFLTTRNIINILNRSSTVALASCGLALVVIGGNLDLSIGSLFSLTLGVSLSCTHYSTTLAVIAPLVIALAIGMANGLIINRFNVSSMIVTLGSYTAIRGFVEFYRKGNIIVGAPFTSYSAITDFRFLGIPSSIFIFIIIACIFQFLLKRTTFGRKLIYQGVNSEAAIAAGINVGTVTIISFMLCSLLIGIATVLHGARLSQGSTTTGGLDLLFDALTAILIGGISLNGGKGSVVNAVIGVLLLVVIVNGLTLLNVPFGWRYIAQGLLILIAIMADVFFRGRNED